MLNHCINPFSMCSKHVSSADCTLTGETAWYMFVCTQCIYMYMYMYKITSTILAFVCMLYCISDTVNMSLIIISLVV